MKSLRDEIPLRGEKDAADLISSEAVVGVPRNERSEFWGFP